MKVKPLQYTSNPLFKDEFTDDFEGALENLKKYYCGLGFRSWRGNNCRSIPGIENHMYLDLRKHLSKKNRYDTIPDKVDCVLADRVIKEMVVGSLTRKKRKK